MSHFLWKDDATLILNCHVQPKASRNALVGLYGKHLKVQISAPPIDGKADSYLLKYIAGEFGVAQRQVTLLRGESSRQKTLEITGPQKIPKAAMVGPPSENSPIHATELSRTPCRATSGSLDSRFYP